MSTIQRLIILPAALFAMIAMSSVAAAQCNSCGTHGAGGFGFPAGGECSNCSGGGAVHNALYNMHQGIETYKADYRLNRARNSAWPLPFACWDREHYYAIFNQQFATGIQVAHTLTSEYFNPETNELNQAGELRVAWIMQNAPQSEKQIYVFEDQTGPTMDQRLANIRNFTDRYYAHLGNASIAKSQILPNQTPASYQSVINGLYTDSQPEPVIPIEAGATLNSSIGN